MLKPIALVFLLALAACASKPQAAAVAAAPASELRTERVVMLMRHGVRPPTKAKVTPAGMNDRPWPKWSVGYHVDASRDREALLARTIRAIVPDETLQLVVAHRLVHGDQTQLTRSLSQLVIEKVFGDLVQPALECTRILE